MGIYIIVLGFGEEGHFVHKWIMHPNLQKNKKERKKRKEEREMKGYIN